MKKEMMKEMLKEVISSKRNVMGKALVFHIALLLLALAGEGMGSESNDRDLPKLMLQTKKDIRNEGNNSVKQNEKETRMKRSSATGLVADKAVEEQVVGEEERSVVGCGEVVLDCPSSTMIVVREGSGYQIG